MRVTKAEIEAYGGLGDMNPTFDSLNVVLGPNEAGKSTLFRAMTTLLFGFSPATRDSHPDSPWSGAALSVSGTLLLDDGSEIEVVRSLRGTPKGDLIRAAGTQPLRNHPIPGLDHVTRAVFTQVFALTLDEMATLQSKTWLEIQDRLIGSLGAQDLKSARELIGALEKEAKALWQPNRRGNQEIRICRDAKKTVVAQAREAMERDRTLRERRAELTEIEAEQHSARQRREGIRSTLKRIDDLAPVRDGLARIQRLDERAGPLDLLGELPEKPQEAVRALTEQLHELDGRIATFQGQSEAEEEVVLAFQENHQAVVEHEGSVQTAIAQAREARRDHSQTKTLEGGIADAERRLQDMSRLWLGGPLSDSAKSALSGIPIGLIRGHLKDFAEAGETLRSLRPGDDPAAEPLPHAVPWLAALGLGGGLALALWGGPQGGLEVFGWGTAVAGALVLTYWWTRRQVTGRVQVGEHARKKRHAEATRAQETAQAGIRGSLEGIEVHAEVLAAPPVELAATLSQMQVMAEEIRTHNAALARLHDAIAEERSRRAALADQLDVTLPEADVEAAEALDSMLRDAVRARDAAATAERVRAQVEQELERAEEERSQLQARHDGITEAVQTLTSMELEAGFDEVDERQAAASQSLATSRDLQSRYPNLEALRDDIAAAEASEEPWTLATTPLEELRVQETELDEALPRLAERVGELRKECEQLEREPTSDQLQGEAEVIQMKIDALGQEHDRLIVLAQVLRDADRKFREENQPDVLRRASEHLRVITADRYERILADEQDSFQVQEQGNARLVSVADSLSTGTKEQVYLALRLAAMDHLDDGRETLPLFVDEAFVNWDSERRAMGLRLLAEVSRNRQVFVFTCHAPWAAEIAKAGGTLLELAAPA